MYHLIIVGVYSTRFDDFYDNVHIIHRIYLMLSQNTIFPLINIKVVLTQSTYYLEEPEFLMLLIATSNYNFNLIN